MKLAAMAMIAVAVTAHPLANEDVLEPSVMNEVEHALSRAPTNSPPGVASAPFPTNGLSRTALALQLVSSQRSDGRWLAGTNDVTAAARLLLENLAR